MKKYIIIISVTIGVFNNARAQDPLFSQFFNSTMNFNPSLIGNDMKKEYKASFITRNRWWGGNIKPFTTNAFSLEKQVTKDKDDINLMYLGVQMLNERSGDGVLANSFFGATLNDKIKVSEYDYLSAALSFVYANRLIDLNSATFQSQFGSFGFIPSSSNYDPISLVSKKYFDLNAGLSLNHISEQKIDYQVGFGLFHINKPNQSFYNDESYVLSMRTVIHGTLYYKHSSVSTYALGTNLQSFSGENVYTIGANYSRIINPTNNFNLTMGLWTRLNESIYPYLAIKYQTLNLGISYDVASSNLRSRFTSSNSVEATLTWDFGKSN